MEERSLRIAFVCHATLGGSGKAAMTLARACRRRGHDVLVISPGAPFGYDAETDPPLAMLAGAPGSTPCSPYPANDAMESESMAPELAGLVRRHGTEVMHVHFAQPFAHAAAGLSDWLGSGGPARICTLHGTDVIGLPAGRREALAHALRRMDAVTAVSAHLAGQAALLLGMPSPEVLPNMIDLDPYPSAQPDVRRHELPRMLHISNFRPVKQTALLAEVLEKVLKMTGAELWLAGDGPDRAELERLLAKKNLSDRVVWLGIRHDVPRLLAQVDLALITSAYESFSLFALEAMAAGVPVAGFATGGLVEIVEDGVSGLLVPGNDTNALARAVGGLLMDRERRTAMGAAGTQIARRYGEARVLPCYEALYARLTEPCNVS